MIRWIHRTQSRRILVPALTFFVVMISSFAVLDYYYDGRIRVSFLPHRIIIFGIGAALLGFLRWWREPFKDRDTAIISFLSLGELRCHTLDSTGLKPGVWSLDNLST